MDIITLALAQSLCGGGSTPTPTPTANNYKLVGYQKLTQNTSVVQITKKQDESSLSLKGLIIRMSCPENEGGLANSVIVSKLDNDSNTKLIQIFSGLVGANYVDLLLHAENVGDCWLIKGSKTVDGASTNDSVTDIYAYPTSIFGNTIDGLEIAATIENGLPKNTEIYIYGY